MYFTTISNIDELKKEYRKLAFKFHPDRGGNAGIMKKINVEYENIFKELSQSCENEKSFNDFVFVDDGFREVLVKIINLENIEIEICGKWIWVSGDTKTNKEALKNADFCWACKKKMWYWRPEEARVKFSTGITDMEYIRNMYGSEKIKANNKKKLIERG